RDRVEHRPARDPAWTLDRGGAQADGLPRRLGRSPQPRFGDHAVRTLRRQPGEVPPHPRGDSAAPAAAVRRGDGPEGLDQAPLSHAYVPLPGYLRGPPRSGGIPGYAASLAPHATLSRAVAPATAARGGARPRDRPSCTPWK